MKNTNDNESSFFPSYYDGLDTNHREYFKKWTVSYLSKKSPAHVKAFNQYLESGNSDKLDKYLRKNNHKELFQAAWRQAKRRQAKRRKFDKEQITLNLSRADRGKLRISAKVNKMSETQYLIMLIQNNDEGLL